MHRRGGPKASGRAQLCLMVAAVVALLVLALPAWAQPDSAAGGPLPERAADPDRGVIPGRYIIVYKPSAGPTLPETAQRERALGFERRFLYRSAFSGFSARLSQAQVRRLEDDPEVDFVSEDRRVEATASVPLAPGEPTPPTGVRRINAATATTVREQSGTNVAVLDTGIDLSHPDLNVASGTNCIAPGSAPTDDDGHGTHVAGSVAARNNGAGVVGVAPDTKVYAVKVLGTDGRGSFSTVACGIDWVTANSSTLDIKVANMSLAGQGYPVASCATTTDALHKAICNSTAAGINYVVAAGNSGWDFDYKLAPDLPAAYPEVLTVTAAADSDGAPGGIGGSSCGEEDDQAASFSNFAATSGGEAHTIAAPGVCINSTWPGGGYSAISGTSMASPHVAGAVALCIDEAGTPGACASKTPAQVIDHMRSEAETYNEANTGYGFEGDPLHSPTSGVYFGHLTTVTPPAASPTSLANTALPSLSGTARDGQTLATSNGSWSGTAPFTYSYQWRRCDSSGGACTNIAGATGSSYTQTAADVGRRLRAVVTAQNSAGSSSATSNPSALVAAAPPANTAPPTISGRAKKGSRLRGSPGTWQGTAPITFSYQWYRCNSTGGQCTKLSGATGKRYMLTRRDVGRRLRLVVTARNSVAARTAASAPSKLVKR